MLLYDQDKQYREEIKKAKLPVTQMPKNERSFFRLTFFITKFESDSFYMLT